MPFPLIVRLGTLTALAASTASFAAVEIKGDYNVEFLVEGTSYTGTVKAAAAQGGAFTAKMEFSSPSTVLADARGKTWGDSVSYDAKYEDKGRGCSGTLSARGTVEKDGSKANGTVSIEDACSGGLSGTFRLWR